MEQSGNLGNWNHCSVQTSLRHLGLQFPNYPITQSISREAYVSLRSKYCPGSTDRRANPTQPRACARHDVAQEVVRGQVAGNEPAVCGVSEILRRGAEAGERDSQAVGFLVPVPRC